MTVDPVKPVITRFPPSPTGTLHIGSVRTALYNYIFAKKYSGTFYIRMEDTDRARSKREFEENIIESFKWLGIESAGPVVRQSERGDVYKRHIEKLITDGFAYVSEEEPTEEGKQSRVIRFKNPNTVVQFDDVIRGTIEVDTTDLGDFVIAKSETEPLYHLAVVVDDHEFGVTHIIRGEDHLSNTPRQILLLEAIGAERPVYAHIPMVLGPDKAKLSKRHGARGVLEYAEDGYLQDAIINFLMLIGWHPSENDQEIFSLDELIETFELEDVQKSPGVFDIEKLSWVNKEHIKKLPAVEFRAHVLEWFPEEIKLLPQWSEERLDRALETIRERVEKFSDIKALADSGDLTYLFEAPQYFAEKLLWKEDPKETALEHLTHVLVLIKDLPEVFSADEIKSAVWPYADEKGRGNVLWPTRYALSGLDRSPDPFTIASILGKAETEARIRYAIEVLSL